MFISSKPLLAKRKVSDEAACGLGTEIELECFSDSATPGIWNSWEEFEQ